MPSVFLEISQTLNELESIKDKSIKMQYEELLKKKRHIEDVAKNFFEKGTRGFHPRVNGILRTKGLEVSEVRRKKNKVFIVFWHRLANLYHNFKKRRQIKWLNIIQWRARRAS
jgi:hypothetical protein